LLTNYNGQTITYDAIGNPLNYRDGMTMEWQNGRELLMCEYSSGYSTYKYGYNGLRTSKTILGPNNRITNVKYIYEGDKLLQMTYDDYVLTFSYDANGIPVSFHVTNGYDIDTDYYYGVNSRGDVIALYNANGSLYTTYRYDAYGKLMSGAPSSAYDIANLNPLRYRGYVYDNETGLYYLQSRYYDPVTCRFINADCQLNTNSINGFNQFAYCDNNPIVRCDPEGKSYIKDYGIGFMPFGGCSSSSGGGGGGGGGGGSGAGGVSGGAGAGAYALGGVAASLMLTATMVSHQSDGMRAEKFLILAFVETATKTIKETTPVYYGADLSGVGNTLNYKTPPMDFITAAAWATATATTHTYGRKASWGLYTKDKEDAYAIALFLGGNLPTKSEIHDNGRSGYYYHYHTYDHKFMGYEHFHLWYGNPT